MNRITFSILFLGLSALTLQSKADLLVGNLNDTAPGSAALGYGGSGKMATQFTTGTLQGTLNSITVSMAVADSDDVNLFLYSNQDDGTYADGIPGAELQQLAFGSLSGQNQTFTTTAEYVLTANTSYWIVMGNATTGNYSIEWNYSNSYYSPDASGATLRHYQQTLLDGVTWNADGGYDYEPQMAAVDITPIPEPATLLLVGLFAGGLLTIRRVFSY